MTIRDQIHAIAVGIVENEFTGTQAASLANDITKESLRGLAMVSVTIPLEEFVKRTALNLIEARIDLIQHSPEGNDPNLSLENVLTEGETESRYEDLLEVFGEDGRPVLECAVMGYSGRETAEFLGISQRRVESLIRRAKRRNLQKIRDAGGNGLARRHDLDRETNGFS